MRYLLATLVVVAMLAASDLVGGIPGRAASPSSPVAGERRSCSDARRGLGFYRSRLDEWLVAMGRRPPATRERPRTCARARELARLARHNSRRARHEHERAYATLMRKWGCIVSHEGTWTSATGNGYYGALQMDLDFQYAYGRQYVRRFGLAHRWPPVVQLLVAERAYDSGRGFGPWPNTRRMCGV
jgi:hypothetical protein